ncbi:MAG: hypothetical protein RIR91_1505 [Verrucomicrobiota bacterium]
MDGHPVGLEVAADDGEVLEREAEAAGEVDVGRADVADALDQRAVTRGPLAVGEPGEDGGLVPGVDAIDVERRVGFGVAELLGFLERVGEREAVLAHAGEDMVTGAIEDADDELEAVGDEAFADGLDDGDAAGDAGLEEELAAMLADGGEDLRAVLAEQGLVGGDHDLACAERTEGELAGLGGPADEFADHVDLGVVDDLERVLGQFGGGDLDGALLLEVADAGLAEVELHAEARLEVGLLFGEVLPDALADGAEAEDTDADGARGGHGN